MDFQWHFQMDFQWQFLKRVHFSVVFQKDYHLPSGCLLELSNGLSVVFSNGSSLFLRDLACNPLPRAAAHAVAGFDDNAVLYIYWLIVLFTDFLYYL